MPRSYKAWTVLPHEPMERLAENLWCVRGSLPNMSLRRNMTIARLADGGLVIHSPVALDPRSMAQLEAWGRPAYLVIPNGAHRLDARVYKRRYPEARVVAPRGQRRQVEEVVPVDLTYDQFSVGDPSVQLITLDGVRESEGAMIVHSSDGTTVVLADAMFNMDEKTDLVGRVFTHLLGSAPGPRVSLLARLFFIKDRKALRADFERLARLPGLVRVIVSHEKIARGPEARQALQLAAGFL